MKTRRVSSAYHSNMLLLLQPGGSSILSTPDPLPSPPFLTHYLFESPWLLGVGLGATGLVASLFLSRNGRARLAGICGFIGLLAGALIFMLSSLVITERERLIETSNRFIRAAIDGQKDPVAAGLRSDVTLTLLGRSSRLGKDDLVRLVARDIVATYQAKDSRIGKTSAVIDSPTVARTQTPIHVVTKLDTGSTRTTWLLTWVRESAEVGGDMGGWRVRSIEAQEIGFMPQGSVPDP